ncbi:MAG: hypothetical protein WCO38_09430 [Verrucomicrobiota bacterium]
MDNSYFTQVAPYMQQLSPKDEAGLNPVFQNIGAQQALHNQLMQQQNQQTQDAGNIGQGYGKGMSGLNPLAMAMALRGKTGDVPLPSTNNAPMTNVVGMGDSMGTGLTQDSFNSGIGFNPYAQTGGFGLKY